MAAFLVWESLPVFRSGALWALLTGTRWDPPELGALPLLAGSLATVLPALALGLPLALGAALYLAEWAPPLVASALRGALALLAAVPTVVIGLVGRTAIAGAIARLAGRQAAPVALAGAVALAVALLPLATLLMADALRAVPRPLREGALALGATRWEVAARVVLPAAAPGLAAAALLTAGRALGETLIVLMAAGNEPRLPRSLLDPVRPVPAAIAWELGEGEGMHLHALFFLGLILFAAALALNWAAVRLGGPEGEGP